MGMIYDIYKMAKEISEARKRPPEDLPRDLHLLFKNFKTAYDSKDINSLRNQLSDNYSGDLYNLKNKESFCRFFNNVFNSIPKGISPNLSISVYEVGGITDKEATLIIQFLSKLEIMGVLPAQKFDSGKVACTAKKDGKHMTWKIFRMETIKEGNTIS